MWNGQVLPKSPEDLINSASSSTATAQTSPLTQLKQIAQNGWTLFTIGQTMWQPIQQAKHFKKLDSTCLELGNCIVRVKERVQNLYENWKDFMAPWLKNWIPLCPTDPRQAFAFILDRPFWLHHLKRAIGRFEILYTLALRKDTVAVEFIKDTKPILMIQNLGDPSISFDQRILSSIKLSEYSLHSIVTGPNRGGKSSFMRGILTNVKFAHTFGVCFSEKAQMTYFSWIADGLRLDDKPGKMSMFEREVSFASHIMSKRDGCGLVLYDELFHSTNPPDAKRSSELFCSELWKKTNCVSVVSTHVYSLAHSAPPSVKKFCLASWNNSGEYTFSYKVKKGICEVSSVDLLLKQFGLL